jgi:hypothetical protein
MFGRGNLRIYINGIPRSQDDLKLLQPLDIDKIEIIRNVGVEYESNVGAVIRIKTKKRRDEKYHVSISDIFQFRSIYLNNRSNVRLYLGNSEKFTQYISLVNDFSKHKGHSTSSSYTYFDDYTNSQLRDNHSRGKRTGPWLSYFMNYSINNDTDLGVQCSGSLYNHWEQINGNWDYNDKTGAFNRDIETKTILSRISLNYKQKINNTGELSIIADHVIRNTDKTTDVKESAADWKANNITDSDNKGNAFSITPEYKTTWKKYTYSTGLKYILLNSKSATEFRPSMNVDHTQLSEYTASAYMVFDADLSFIEIKSGIRMEYTNSDIRSDNELNNLSRDFFNWIPYISLSGKPNEHINLTTYYRQGLSRPSLNRLNSTVNYIDSLLYSIGNPRLKPVVTDVFGFSAGIYKFDFSLEYSIHKNNIISERIPDSENPNILIDTYDNTKEKNSNLTVGISYSFNNPVFTNMTGLYYTKQFNVNMPFRNEIVRFNKPKYNFKTSGNVKIFKNTSLNYDYSYNNGGDSNYTRTNTLRNRLDLTVVQFLMNRKLMISFAVDDVFNNKKRNMTTYYTGNTVVTDDRSHFNSRFVIFSLRYNWGVNKSIQQKSSNSEIGRL